MIVQIERIAFDHANGKPAERSVPLGTAAGLVPPWSPAETSPSLAAYPLRSDRPRPLLVEATFSFPNGFVPGVSVRAQPVSDEDVLGSTNVVTLPRPAAGSGLASVMCRLTNTRVWEHGIGRYPLMWQWQYRLAASSAWLDLRVTHHIVYVTLALPTGPWPENGPLRPDVLDLACAWARGLTFEPSRRAARQVSRRIETALFALGDRPATPVTYLEAGDSRYTRSPAVAFALTDFLSLLAGHPPGGDNNVNCSDCASALATFANALGCGLRQVKVSDVNDVMMRTNPIVTVGAARRRRRPGREPVRVSRSRQFRFHEFAVLDDPHKPPSQDEVFDACLMVDLDTNPTSKGVTHIFGLAAGMPAGSLPGRSRAAKYLKRLLSPIAQDSSQVHPVTFRALDGHGFNPADVDEPTNRVRQFFLKEIAKNVGPPVLLAIDEQRVPILQGYTLFDRVVNPSIFAADELFIRSIEYYYVAVSDSPSRRAADKRIRVSVAVARDVQSARDALSWLLAQSAADFSAIPKPAQQIGDVAFSAAKGSSLYIVWGQVFLRMESIGKVRVSVRTLARNLVDSIGPNMATLGRGR